MFFFVYFCVSPKLDWVWPPQESLSGPMSFFGSLYFKSKPPWNWQQQALHMFFPHHFGRDISSSQPLLKMKRCFRVVSGRVQGWPLCYCMWFEDDSSIYSIYIYIRICLLLIWLILAICQEEVCPCCFGFCNLFLLQEVSYQHYIVQA